MRKALWLTIVFALLAVPAAGCKDDKQAVLPSNPAPPLHPSEIKGVGGAGDRTP